MFSECTIQSAQVRVHKSECTSQSAQVRVQHVRVQHLEMQNHGCNCIQMKTQKPFCKFYVKESWWKWLKRFVLIGWPMKLSISTLQQLARTSLNWFILESIVYNPVVQRSFGMFGGDSSSDNGDAALDWLAGWWPMVTRWRHHESLLWVTLTVVNHQSAV